MDQERRITRVRTRMIMKRPFWGHLGLYLQPREARGLGTVGTDGSTLWYDPDATAQWSDQELEGVVAHEIGHCAFGHMWRRGSRDKDRWNQAADHAVNHILLSDGFVLPKGHLAAPQFKNMSAEAVYAHMPQTRRSNTLDDHNVWENNPESDGNDGNKSGESGNNESGAQTGDQDNSERGWKQRVAQAAQQARMQGKLPGWAEELVGELLRPQVDWTEILRDLIQSTVKNDYSLTPFSKRYMWVPLYMPSVRGEELEIAVAVDTSASVSSSLLKRFLSEVAAIAQQYTNYRVHFMEIDTRVAQYTCVSSDEGNDFPLQMHGRGGTEFTPAFEEVEKRELDISCLVYFTDGYGYAPDRQPPYPTIWIIPEDGHPQPWGQIIRVRE